jgi:pimeloyl-ACP methyl ester carboxylesterase
MFKKRIFSKTSCAALALLLTTLIGAGALHVSALGSQSNCRQVAPISVTLSPTDHTVYHVASELCGNGPLTGKTIQLLIHGLTYDHRYWDWPSAPQNSYIQSATRAGYTTLAIDRIGDGESSHPTDGTQVTTASSSYVIHQIIQKLHAGAINHVNFHKVMTVGHSFGSASVIEEAATYHDVNGVILSGYMHDVSPAALSTFPSVFYPASQDPKFANSGLNDTYLTTTPGAREQLFFNAADASQSVIATDEQIKQPGTTGELDLNSFNDANALTPDINVPVLLAMGQYDTFFCEDDANLPCDSSTVVLAREQSHFSPKAHLQTYVLPNSGHDMNLHRNAQQWFKVANDWANSHVGRN